MIELLYYIVVILYIGKNDMLSCRAAPRCSRQIADNQDFSPTA